MVVVAVLLMTPPLQAKTPKLFGFLAKIRRVDVRRWVRLAASSPADLGLPQIRATQRGLGSRDKAKQFISAMKSGSYRYQDAEGQIGGRLHDGVYYVGEGHHRAVAALEWAYLTGDTKPIKNLLSFGKWYPSAEKPRHSRTMPIDDPWHRLLNHWGL